MTVLYLRIRASLFAAIAALAACSPASARGASGTYVAADETGAIMLQIVEGADHSLSGTYQSLFLKEGGNLESSNTRVTGVADGADITLTVQAIEFLPISVNYSGTLRGDHLELTYVTDGEVTQFALARASIDDFVQWSGALRSESERQQAEQARRFEDEWERRNEETRLERLRALTEELEQVTAAGAELRANIAQTTEHHREVTATMNALIDTYDQLARRSDYEAQSQRWQLELQIPMGPDESARTHDEVLRVSEDFGRRHEARLAAITEHRAVCEDREDANCERLLSAAEAYIDHAQELLAALTQAEVDYFGEREKQLAIVAHLD